MALVMIAIFEDDIHDSEVSANTGVQSDVCEGDEVAIEFEFGAFHVVRADRRVVADLFVTQWDSFEVALEGLTKDGVEGFLHD